jgi:hypothetical protein
MTNKHSKLDNPIAPIKSSNSGLTAISPINTDAPLIMPSEEIKAVEAVKSIEPSLSIELSDQISSVTQLFDEIIAAHHVELQKIVSHVNCGEWTEAEAEEKLLRLALIHSFNMPPMIAETILPLLKENVDEHTSLRKGLQKLWRK